MSFRKYQRLDLTALQIGAVKLSAVLHSGFIEQRSIVRCPKEPHHAGGRWKPDGRSVAGDGQDGGAAAALSFTYFVGIDIDGIYAFKRIETPAGGTLKVVLPDGSGVDVGGESQLRAAFTRSARAVTLQHGEAFFHVAKDAARPFTVHAGTTSIIAIGTAFNVRWSGERVVVSVAEGAVRVTSPARLAADSEIATKAADESARLRAGEQLSVERGGAGPVFASIDANAVAAWRGGQLSYLNEPLESVVADVGRYTAQRITVTDPELRITSTVLEHNLDGWLESLEEAFPVRVVREENGRIRLEKR